MLKKIFLLYIIPAFILTSCGRLDEIEILDMNNLQFKGLEKNTAKFEAGILVDNPSHHKIKIKEINARLVVNNVYVGKLMCTEEFVIPSSAESLIDVPFELRLSNIFSGAAMLYRLSRESRATVQINGYVIAQSGFIRKKINVERTMTVNPSKLRK